MSNPIESYLAKGLSEEEAKTLESYELRGKPGLAKIKADVFLDLYKLGYSCQDIAKNFPEYELGLLLHARIKFNWDKERQDYQANLLRQTAHAASVFKVETIRLLYDVLAATQVKHRQEILRYLAAPDREQVPEILPKSLHGIGQLVSIMKDLTEAERAAAASASASSSPLVSINLSSGDAKTIEISQDKVKEALLKKVKRDE